MSRLTKVCDGRGEAAVAVDLGAIAHRIDFALTFFDFGFGKITMAVRRMVGATTAGTAAVQAQRVACTGLTYRREKSAFRLVGLKP